MPDLSDKPITRTGQPPTDPAWSAADLAANPHARDDKPQRVRRMFAEIAHAYDLNNRLHALGRDQAWRRAAVRMARITPTDRVLDVACGTGDLAMALARAGAASVLGVDFTPQMIDLARAKLARLGPDQAQRLDYQIGDAMALDLPDDSFDVVSIAFGIRNVQDPAAALGEFARVLRPGGRLIILEFAEPTLAPVRWFNRFYCGWVMPRTASLIARDRSGAYRYLPRSVASFMSRDELKHAMAGAGFGSIEDRSMSLGICVCYRGLMPG